MHYLHLFHLFPKALQFTSRVFFKLYLGKVLGVMCTLYKVLGVMCTLYNNNSLWYLPIIPQPSSTWYSIRSLWPLLLLASPLLPSIEPVTRLRHISQLLNCPLLLGVTCTLYKVLRRCNMHIVQGKHPYTSDFLYCISYLFNLSHSSSALVNCCFRFSLSRLASSITLSCFDDLLSSSWSLT